MLTKTDLDNIDQRTTKIVNKAISKAISDNNIKLFQVMATKEDLKNYSTKEDLDRKMDQLITTVDKIYGVVKKIDQEQSVLSHTSKNHPPAVAMLQALRAGEIRITKIEQAIA